MQAATAPAATAPLRTEVPITIRMVLPADRGLLISSWACGFARKFPPAEHQKNWYYAAHNALIEKILASPQSVVLVAHWPEDVDQIMGFAVGEPATRVLHWVWTKREFSRSRLATRLLGALFGEVGPQAKRLTCSAMTPHMRANMERWNCDYNQHKLCLVR